MARAASGSIRSGALLFPGASLRHSDDHVRSSARILSPRAVSGAQRGVPGPPEAPLNPLSCFTYGSAFPAVLRSGRPPDHLGDDSPERLERLPVAVFLPLWYFAALLFPGMRPSLRPFPFL